MSFANNIRFLRRSKHLSQNELAEMMDYKSFTTIQKWEDGTSVPSFRALEKLAAYFAVDVDDLMNGDLTITDNSTVPVLGVVRGGEPIYAENNFLGTEHVFPDDARHSDCFYLEVVGDSMKNARILPGDLVYVHQQSVLESGDIGVFLLDDTDATIKRILFKDGNIILKPENEDYKPIVLSASDIIQRNFRIIGKVLHNRIRM